LKGTKVVAGLHKNSLIDYPGKVSAVVFVSGCNFRCPYCHNPELARGQYPQKIPLADVIDFLSRRRALLDGVVITGGEPTLWPHLFAFCRDLRQLKMAVKLDTNGSRPDVIRQAIQEELVDYIAMDIKTRPDHYGPPLCDRAAATLVRESIGLIMAEARDYEFRTTCVPPFVDESIMAHIAKEIRGARRYILQPFRPEIVLDRDYFLQGNEDRLSDARLDRLRSIALSDAPSCQIR
jgi:pyruvate formate lyase activating enzyme